MRKRKARISSDSSHNGRRSLDGQTQRTASTQPDAEVHAASAPWRRGARRLVAATALMTVTMAGVVKVPDANAAEGLGIPKSRPTTSTMRDSSASG